MIKNLTLKTTTTFWFVVFLIGQWIFAAYVGIYHGTLFATKGLKGMDETHMPNGYISGDDFGNIIAMSHFLMAVFAIAGGPLQLIPKIQRDYRKFHRVNGRVYLYLVFVLAIGGLYLTWSRPRPSFGSIYQDIAISLEAILIITFGILMLRFALKRKIKEHRKWALRLIIVGSGVWFLRIGYKAYYFIEDLFGFEISNSFDYIAFASFLIPLSILELYFRVKKSKSKTAKRQVSALIFIITLFMCLGIFLATKEMWFPRILSIF